MWNLREWLRYMKHVGKNPPPVPKDRLPRTPPTPQHWIFNMACLEITGTELAKQITLPFLQRELDPMRRFAEALINSKDPHAALYVLSSKAGSFTVSCLVLFSSAELISLIYSPGTSMRQERYIGCVKAYPYQNAT